MTVLASVCPVLHHFRMSQPLTLTAHVVRDGEWFLAFSPEFPEGNGQGRTVDAALESLRDSIRLLMEDRRADARAAGEELIPPP